MHGIIITQLFGKCTLAYLSNWQITRTKKKKKKKELYENQQTVSTSCAVFLNKRLGKFPLSEVQKCRIISKSFFKKVQKCRIISQTFFFLTALKVSVLNKQLAPLVPDSFRENPCQQAAYTLGGGLCFYIQLYCRRKSILRAASKGRGEGVLCNSAGRFLLSRTLPSLLELVLSNMLFFKNNSIAAVL